jgi:hypothetical protein
MAPHVGQDGILRPIGGALWARPGRSSVSAARGPPAARDRQSHAPFSVPRNWTTQAGTRLVLQPQGAVP